MASLTKCLREAAEFLQPATVARITGRAAELRKEGVEPGIAAQRAVTEAMNETDSALKTVETAEAEGRTLYEEPDQTDGKAAEVEAAPERLAAIEAQFPDLEVMLDGMERPMPLREFMARVREEAADEAADAPLHQRAVECALLNGL